MEEWSQEKQRERYPPQCRYYPDLTPSPELSYMLGVRYGDLTINPYDSRLRVKDEDFAEEFARCAGVVMGREYEVTPRSDVKNQVQVCVYSKILCDFFKLSLEDHKKWIESDYPAEFIRGFMDSDGNANEYPRVRAGNTDKDVLYYVSGLLKKYFGISSSVTTPPSSVERVGKIGGYIREKFVIPRKVLHILYIGGLDNVEEFYWSIDFSILRKSEVLERGLYVNPHPVWRPEV